METILFNNGGNNWEPEVCLTHKNYVPCKGCLENPWEATIAVHSTDPDDVEDIKRYLNEKEY